MRPRRGLRVALALGAAAAPLVAASAAGAATAAPGTQNLQLSAGQLSVGPLTPGTLQGVVGGTASGQLPSASFTDTTGSGDGWQGSVAASNFIYTGAWQQSSGSPALASTAAGAWTGTADGITITVMVGAGGTPSSTPFTWSDTAGNSGSGTATNGTPAAIEDGVTIDFAAGTAYASGDQYSVHVGAQAAQALSLDAAQGSITPAAGVQSPPPGFVNSGAVVAGGGTTYGAAVPMVSAALGTGMGTYAVAPGAQVAVDASSWAATYVAQVQYTIATGPSSAPAQARAGAVVAAVFPFPYTGSLQTYTVPAGDYWLQVQATGGSGGSDGGTAGGLGAQVSAYLPVTPGQTVYMLVAGAGQSLGNSGSSGAGGYGGGGAGGAARAGSAGAGGGGASAIFIGGTSSTDLALVAGGGGGATYESNVGGAGGTPDGAAGGGGSGGGGGTQSAGGAGGASAGDLGTAGSPGTAFSLTAASGGAGEPTTYGTGGGGGGGGYFGGGGGGFDSDTFGAGGGGGGSSWVEPSAQQVTYSLAASAGNGLVVLRPLASLP